MKGTHLGEFEELILLTVAALYDGAYGVAVQEDLRTRSHRKASLSAIHMVLHRLERKGFLDSRFDGATSERGGRRKLLFRVSRAGQKALAHARALRDNLWVAIPESSFTISRHE